MNNQVKTVFKLIGSIILIALLLDVMIGNIIFSSFISFIICVVFFYDPKKVEARYNKEKELKEAKLKTELNPNKNR